MKYETYSEYDPLRVGLAESAFLTVWASLGQWHGDLVLVGGLVPKYLCGDLTQQRSLPRPATLDVDLGIALGADSGQYGKLLWELSGQGFKPNKQQPSRFEKVIGDVTVPIDFLVEKPPHTTGTTQVEDITAAAIAAFAEEVRHGNPACPDALRTLKEHFANENSPGPVKASHFVLGQIVPGESKDTRFLRTTLRQDMVDAATQLLRVTNAPQRNHAPSSS